MVPEWRWLVPAGLAQAGAAVTGDGVGIGLDAGVDDAADDVAVDGLVGAEQQGDVVPLPLFAPKGEDTGTPGRKALQERQPERLDQDGGVAGGNQLVEASPRCGPMPSSRTSTAGTGEPDITASASSCYGAALRCRWEMLTMTASGRTIAPSPHGRRPTCRQCHGFRAWSHSRPLPGHLARLHGLALWQVSWLAAQMRSAAFPTPVWSQWRCAGHLPLTVARAASVLAPDG